MSMLDTLGGLGGGLGGSGGVGGSIPSNSSAASASASVAVDPTTALGGVGGGYASFGPFNVNFPGVQAQGQGSVNAPNPLSAVIPQGLMPIVAIVGALILAVIFLRK